mmetsp:Transcript_1932/g.5848  ORF Transcript_1932/g.5848 Transcript_1932/m.5848 type:complete len:218 (+) Transcript_1932:406-1059(+)
MHGCRFAARARSCAGGGEAGPRRRRGLRGWVAQRRWRWCRLRVVALTACHLPRRHPPRIPSVRLIGPHVGLLLPVQGDARARRGGGHQDEGVQDRARAVGSLPLHTRAGRANHFSGPARGRVETNDEAKHRVRASAGGPLRLQVRAPAPRAPPCRRPRRPRPRPRPRSPRCRLALAGRRVSLPLPPSLPLDSLAAAAAAVSFLADSLARSCLALASL